MKVGLDRGTPVTLAARQGPGWLLGIAVDRQNVYWTDQATSTVRKVPIDGGATITLASGQSFACGIAVDSSGVYRADTGDGSMGFNGTIMKIGLDGGAPVALASGRGYPQGIAIDAVSVYWGEGDVMRIAK